MDSETDATHTVVGSIESAAPRAKRQRKEADKRRARVQDLHNKYADIDFTRYQDTHADQYPPTLSMAEDASAAQGNSGAASGLIVPVKPVPTATVQHWRLWESYERNGDKSFSETEFALLCEQEGHRRHYKGPFGYMVQSNLPPPGELLHKAGKPVPGRFALQKLQKQLGVMCLRLQVGHFLERDRVDIRWPLALARRQLQSASP